MKIRGPVPYPVLAAVYPVLALAAANPGEIPGLWVLGWPIALSILVAVCTWGLLSFVVHDRDRRAFITFMIVVLFATYGYFTLALREVASLARYFNTALPFFVVTGYFTVATYLVLRLVPNPRNLTRFLTVLTSVLVGWNLAVLLGESARTHQLDREVGRTRPAQHPMHADSGSGPDIYLIILDKYTGSHSLKRNFEFDNSGFETFLRRRGFILPNHATANYIYTGLSLASLLNYRYLDSVPPEPRAQRRNKVRVNHLVEDNAVWQFLQGRGYRFIFFPTAFPFTATNRLADLQVPDPRRILSEFEIAWRRTTLAEPVLSWICQRFSCAQGFRPFADEATFLEWKFGQLGRVPTWPRDGRPLFVFAHLTVPHEPYIFNADCSVHPPFWPSYSVVSDERPEKQAYIAQITCLNRRLETIVQHLLNDSPSPPIILLQSDHGHGRMPLHIPDVHAVTADRIAERADIFAAYYLPGAGKGIVSDSISPVNVFRMVFREYFKADLQPLPNRTYWSPGTQLFQFTRVQDGHPRGD